MRCLMVTALVLMPLALSCELRQMYILDNGVEMKFIFGETATVREPLVCVRSYDSLTARESTMDFVPLGGGRVNVPAGDRTVIAHTFGSETVVLDDEDSSETVTARTNTADESSRRLWVKAASLCNAATEIIGTTVAVTPDPYFVGTVRERVPLRSEGDEPYVLTVPMRDITSYRVVRLEGIRGLEYVSAVELFLAGCARGVILSGGDCEGDCVMRASAGRVPGTDDVCAAFRVFGRGAKEMTLYVLVTDISGEQFGWELSAGALVENDGVTLLDAENLKIEAPAVSGRGFLPTLTDWDEDIYDIYL